MRVPGSSFHKSGLFFIVTVICILLAIPILTAAAEYPKKPVNIIVTYGAGGGTDVIFRAASSVIHQYWASPMVPVAALMLFFGQLHPSFTNTGANR
jgi:hypothetical protein